MGLQSERLYYGDSYLVEFASVVAQVKEKDGETWVRLKESAFYPTSGGQPHDVGVITAAVDDAQPPLLPDHQPPDHHVQSRYAVTGVEIEDGQVWHRVSQPSEGEASVRIEVGQSVMGRIDWDRRFDFMQQHSGQHILSACFEQALGAKTTSFHMGDTYSTIDLDIASLSPSDTHSVMVEANRWIWRDVPIRARFVSEEELASMKLRKAPSVTEDVRIVTIVGLEDNACGGTHPTSTGQVGQILITKTERMRGGVRVTFVCGARSLTSAKEAVDMVRLMANGLSVGTSDLPGTVDSLLNQVKEGNRRYEVLRGQYANLLAQGLAKDNARVVRGTHVLLASLPHLDEIQELKRMATSSAQWLASAEPDLPQIVVFAGELGGRTHLVAQATEGAIFGADAVVKGVLPAMGGKGGGNANAAQGSAPASAEKILAAMEAFIVS